jgi:hypothetical protein
VNYGPTMAQRNDLRRTPPDAITLRRIGQERRASFGRGLLRTGPATLDPVALRRPRILPRPFQPARRFGVDVYL